MILNKIEGIEYNTTLFELRQNILHIMQEPSPSLFIVSYYQEYYML